MDESSSAGVEELGRLLTARPNLGKIKQQFLK
jgi:hypothetical protein